MKRLRRLITALTLSLCVLSHAKTGRDALSGPGPSQGGGATAAKDRPALSPYLYLWGWHVHVGSASAGGMVGGEIERKIRSAAASGYRLLALDVDGDAWAAVMEKVSDGPLFYDYRIVGKTYDFADMLLGYDQLPLDGSNGFRIVANATFSDDYDPNDLDSDIRDFVVLEQSPAGRAECKYLQVPHDAKLRHQQLMRAWRDGYKPVAPLHYPRARYIMEKCGGATAAVTTPVSDRYVIIPRSKISVRQQALERAAAAGFRITNGALFRAFGLMEFVADVGAGHDYLLLGKVRSREINEAGARGFRLVPHSILRCGGFWTYAVMERPPGSRTRYEYLLLKGFQKLQGELDRAVEMGFRPVDLVFQASNGCLVMERSKE